MIPLYRSRETSQVCRSVIVLFRKCENKCSKQLNTETDLLKNRLISQKAILFILYTPRGYHFRNVTLAKCLLWQCREVVQ
ncbi:hypothetical protein B9Z55_012302 [Caenorhabditis nigoni]|uniref:Uncharacterized protein n=1 Tax=Caenorhabditis nigoni TaxID=1611254 RepID=A0A2G5TWP1_9PELO|nr:hypothetical protein B9Z55_012302 [Caenorhabditis nigoni]